MKTKLLTSGCLLALILFYFQNKSSVPDYQYIGQKLNGLSFVAPHKPIDDSHIKPVKELNANYVSLMPYGFLPENSATLRYSTDENSGQWWGEKPEGVRTCISLAKQNGMKVMLKPHIWLGRGSFTGDLDFKTDAEWLEFERSYAQYLLHYAQLAQESKAEVFCIATEMQNMVEKRPAFWNELIDSIRVIYKGQLTYAENWDSYEDVPFWDRLDFVGVDAYFPLSKERDPDLNSLLKGWKKHKNQLKSLSFELQKPILFTEFGYRSCDFATDQPWETDYSKPTNEALQERAYEAILGQFWEEKWFAGGFLWKWFPLKESGKSSRDLFCIREKPAEILVKKYYGKIL